MLRRFVNAALRRGVQTAVIVTADTAASATTKTFIQSFEVNLPTTVYVRASMSEITLRYRPGNRVEVAADLRASFGWELMAEQDDAGVYIVAKRKPLVGQLSSANFDLSVPPGINLMFNLTPGSVRVMNINGKFNVAGTSLMAVPAEVSIQDNAVRSARK